MLFSPLPLGLVALAVSSLASPTPSLSPSYTKISLNNIETLYFQANQTTVSRHADNKQQLACHGSGCFPFPDVRPTSATCTAIDIRERPGEIYWDCGSSVMWNKGLIDFTVRCEHWEDDGRGDYAGDRDVDIVKGSCSATYNPRPFDQGNDGPNHLPTQDGPSAEQLVQLFQVFVAVLIIFVLLRRWIRSIDADDRDSRQTRRHPSQYPGDNTTSLLNSGRTLAGPPPSYGAIEDEQGHAHHAGRHHHQHGTGPGHHHHHHHEPALPSAPAPDHGTSHDHSGGGADAGADAGGGHHHHG